MPRDSLALPKRMPVGDKAVSQWRQEQSKISKRQLQYDAALRRSQETDMTHIHDRIIEESMGMVMLAIEDIQRTEAEPDAEAATDDETIQWTAASTSSSSSHTESKIVPKPKKMPKKRITGKSSPEK